MHQISQPDLSGALKFTGIRLLRFHTLTTESDISVHRVEPKLSSKSQATSRPVHYVTACLKRDYDTQLRITHLCHSFTTAARAQSPTPQRLNSLHNARTYFAHHTRATARYTRSALRLGDLLRERCTTASAPRSALPLLLRGGGE